jgi:folate-binding protein YgfZ
MNKDWQKYLESYPVTHITTDDIELEQTDILCAPEQFSTIVIAGEDAGSFMQGQFTNDVDNVDDQHSQLSAFCNAKGRMIANFRLFRYQQNYFMNLKSDLVESSIQHLQNYVLRANVAIQDVTDQLIQTGISGENSPALLKPFIEDISDETDSVSFNDDYIAICIASVAEVPRYEIYCTLDKAKALWEALSVKTEVTAPSTWELLNIRAGLPFIDNTTSEEFVPQMANMELINGISFSKGCYTGQEIVARTHYLGKQKRRTNRIKITSEVEPKPGQQLATDTSTENQYTGTLINVQAIADDVYEALAVIQIKAAETEKLKLKEGVAEISLLKLPYSLTVVEEQSG